MNVSLMVEQDKLLKDLCTFGIGGPARYFVEVKTVAQMQEVLHYCQLQKLPYFILGKGSNCLFDDRGFNGMVILNKIDFFHTPQPGVFHVGSGYSFSLLGTQTARQGWSGLEFASGIPGSVGGAVFMNAGAQGGETATYLSSVDFIPENGTPITLKKDDLLFSYRTSLFQKQPGAILGATFSLLPSPEARQKQIELFSYRKETQPYRAKSAGCIFRNPQGAAAGALIEKCGLKGQFVEGAQVSEKHANFIINANESSAQNVLTLIALIQEQVKKKMDVELESEVRYIPYEAIINQQEDA